jgi:hypothetical protein
MRFEWLDGLVLLDLVVVAAAEESYYRLHFGRFARQGGAQGGSEDL